MQIYVDADACPVKAEIVRVAERHGLTVHMVSNSWMRLDESPLIKRVVVNDGPDVADDWIAERICASDIAVTADILLAARCLKAGAQCIGPTGKPFSDANIGMALAMRDMQGTCAKPERAVASTPRSRRATDLNFYRLWNTRFRSASGGHRKAAPAFEIVPEPA
jgi:uncharacterized protein YaiI (UPF0178 family)